MYARLISLCFNEDVSHDRAHDLNRRLVEEFRGVDGFSGFTFLLMSTARRGMTLTYWDDADSASKAGERILPMIMDEMRDLLIEPPEIAGYEVIDREMIE